MSAKQSSRKTRTFKFANTVPQSSSDNEDADFYSDPKRSKSFGGESANRSFSSKTPDKSPWSKGKENISIISTSPFFQKTTPQRSRKSDCFVIDSEDNNSRQDISIPTSVARKNGSMFNNNVEEDLAFLEGFEDFEVDETGDGDLVGQQDVPLQNNVENQGISSQAVGTRFSRIKKKIESDGEDEEGADKKDNEDDGVGVGVESPSKTDHRINQNDDNDDDDILDELDRPIPISSNNIGKRKKAPFNNLFKLKQLKNREFWAQSEFEGSFSNQLDSHYSIDPILNRAVGSSKKGISEASDDFVTAKDLKRSDRQLPIDRSLRRVTLGLRQREPKSYNVQKTFDDLGLTERKSNSSSKKPDLPSRSSTRKTRSRSMRKYIDDVAAVDGDADDDKDDEDMDDEDDLGSFIVDDDHVEYEDNENGNDFIEENDLDVDESLIIPSKRRLRRHKSSRRIHSQAVDPSPIFIQEVNNHGSSDDENNAATSNRFKIMPVNMSKEEFSVYWKKQNEETKASIGDAHAEKSVTNLNHSSFESVFGLDDHIKKLKEVIVFPILHPTLYSSMGITPPKGLLFYGPPGTGKTHMAHCLVNICSNLTGRKVPFFIRKGGDLLSKWVGEAEKQLMELFEVASKVQPSIIFFDEIDGIAPVRSSKNQDQSHTSVVSTLLALMDGIGGRGSQVIIIGATNRIDSIDPALRRPGRFDYELYFGLPDAPSRLKMLKTWSRFDQAANGDNERVTVSVTETFLKGLSDSLEGCNGADVKALCKEAAIRSMRRSCSHLYDESSWKKQSHVEGVKSVLSMIEVVEQDFIDALQSLSFGAEKFDIYQPNVKPLCSRLETLLRKPHAKCINWFENVVKRVESNGKRKGSSFSVLIHSSKAGLGASHLLADLLCQFRKKQEYHIHSLNLFQLIFNNTEQILLSTVQECARHSPSILVLSDLHLFYRVTRSPAHEPIWEWTLHTIFNRLLSFEKNVIIIGLWEPSVVESSSTSVPDDHTIVSSQYNHSHNMNLVPDCLESVFRLGNGGANSNSLIVNVDFPEKNVIKDFLLLQQLDQSYHHGNSIDGLLDRCIGLNIREIMALASEDQEEETKKLKP